VCEKEGGSVKGPRWKVRERREDKNNFASQHQKNEL
jgi:hypothetical protein